MANQVSVNAMKKEFLLCNKSDMKGTEDWTVNGLSPWILNNEKVSNSFELRSFVRFIGEMGSEHLEPAIGSELTVSYCS